MARGDSDRITDNREHLFELDTARFRDPETGVFEPGSAPPDLDETVDRFRAEDGRFKDRAADLMDEEKEVIQDSLDPMG